MSTQVTSGSSRECSSGAQLLSSCLSDHCYTFPSLWPPEMSHPPHTTSYNCNGGGGGAGASSCSECFPLSHYPMMLYCCLDSEPHMGLKDNSFSALPCNFKSRKCGASMSMSHPPGCLPIDVTIVGFRERLPATAVPRPCCVAPDGRQDSWSITLHQRQI